MNKWVLWGICAVIILVILVFSANFIELNGSERPELNKSCETSNDCICDDACGCYNKNEECNYDNNIISDTVVNRNKPLCRDNICTGTNDGWRSSIMISGLINGQFVLKEGKEGSLLVAVSGDGFDQEAVYDLEVTLIQSEISESACAEIRYDQSSFNLESEDSIGRSIQIVATAKGACIYRIQVTKAGADGIINTEDDEAYASRDIFVVVK